jgi:hypothetical protein
MRKSTDTTFGSDDMNKHTTKKVSAIAIALFPVALSGLTGCGGLQQQGTTPAIVQGVALHGSIHGGQQPVSGANVQFYAAGSTGYGSAYLYPNGATSLLGTNVVTSDGGGGFSISNDYTCPSPTTQVYLVATGGNPGLGTGTNANLAMMVALGPCGLLSSATDVNVNEMTTVATVWALSPFMTGIVNIGTSAGNAQGLTCGFWPGAACGRDAAGDEAEYAGGHPRVLRQLGWWCGGRQEQLREVVCGYDRGWSCAHGHDYGCDEYGAASRCCGSGSFHPFIGNRAV